MRPRGIPAGEPSCQLRIMPTAKDLDSCRLSRILLSIIQFPRPADKEPTDPVCHPAVAPLKQIGVAVSLLGSHRPLPSHFHLLPLLASHFTPTGHAPSLVSVRAPATPSEDAIAHVGKTWCSRPRGDVPPVKGSRRHLRLSNRQRRCSPQLAPAGRPHETSCRVIRFNLHVVTTRPAQPERVVERPGVNEDVAKIGGTYSC